MKSRNYNRTKTACYLGYVSQAIVVSFAPLLFIHFRNVYGIVLGEVALIPALFFAVRLMVDLFCAVFADKIGYRKCILAVEACTSLGLIGLAEVLCNPIIEALC